MNLDLFTTPRGAAVDALHAATAVYTAEPVVDDLLGRIDWPRGDRRLVDPSCGDGVFLGRALELLLLEEPAIRADRLATLLEGWEIHPHAARQARSRIARLLVAHGWVPSAASEVADRLVRKRDFLTEGPTSRRFHAIAGNPPYIRFPRVPELLQREYVNSVPRHARADLLHSFLDRCRDVLTDDGEIGFVTADRWLFNANAARLRAVLGERLGIDHLSRLDSASAFYRPKQRSAGTPPRVHPVAVILRQRSPSCIALGERAIYPDAPDSDAGAGATLGDISTIRLAPWLGTPGIFVVSGHVAERLPREALVPCVDTDDIVDGLLSEPRRFAIRTIPTEPPAEAAMLHLDAELYRMAPRGRRTPRWLPPEAWHRLDLSHPSLLVPRIARDLRAVRLSPETLPINPNLSIVAAGRASLDEIEAILASERARAWMRRHAPRLENGFFSVTTTLLRRLPVEG